MGCHGNSPGLPAVIDQHFLHFLCYICYWSEGACLMQKNGFESYQPPFKGDGVHVKLLY